MSDECIHLLDLATCTLCNGRAKRERARTTWSNPFAARYSGRCFVCDERIDEGDRICISDGAVAHEECAT